MSLNDLQKKIYKPGGGEQLEKDRDTKTPYEVGGVHVVPPPSQYDEFKPPAENFFQKHKKKIIIYLSIFLVSIGAFVAGLMLYRIATDTFAPNRVQVTIEGPSEIISGDEVEFKVKYINKNKVDLKNVKLAIQLPDALIDSKISLLGQEISGDRVFNVPDLKAKESVEIVLKGRILAEKGSIQFIKAKLTYIPNTIKSSFEVSSELSVTVKDTPFVITLLPPLQSASGDAMEYTVSVNNNSEAIYKNLELRLEYAEGFSLMSSSQKNNGNKGIFVIPEMKARGSYEVKISGILSGVFGDIKVIKAKVGIPVQNKFTLYASAQSSTKIAEPYVELVQSLGDQSTLAVDEGSTLNYKISFKNTTDVKIGEGFLKVKLESPFIEIATLKTDGADFDASTNTITWNASTVEALKYLTPNDSGTVTFSVKIKDRLPINTFSDKNFIITTRASFESNEIPTTLGVNKIIQSNVTEVKVHTKLFVANKVYYRDSSSSIINSGPNPPQVNQTSSYTINLEAQNLNNDVSDLIFTTTLPANVVWTNQFNTNGVGTLTYNERTKELVWKVGTVPAHTGFLRPVYRAVFQVALTPPPNGNPEGSKLLESVSYSAKDSFTGKAFSGTLGALGIKDLSDIK